MNSSFKRTAGAAIALSLGLALGACAGGGAASNGSLNSVHQPIVTRSNFSLDLSSNGSGLPVNEQRRLADWFETMQLGYGDRVGIEDAMGNSAVSEDVGAIASRYGILVSDGAPVTEGYIAPGNVRVVVTRSTAHVPGCNDWSDNNASNLGNNTSAGFGCAVNSNMAAMVADPEHLLNGATGTGETVVMSSTKAITTYREKPSTGAGALSQVSSEGN